MEGCKASSLDEVMDRVTHADISLDYGPFLEMSPEVRAPWQAGQAHGPYLIPSGVVATIPDGISGLNVSSANASGHPCGVCSSMSLHYLCAAVSSAVVSVQPLRLASSTSACVRKTEMPRWDASGSVLRRMLFTVSSPWYDSDVVAQGLDLLRGLFQRDASARLTAAEAQLHPWFAAQLGWEAESLRITAELASILDKGRTCGRPAASERVLTLLAADVGWHCGPTHVHNA